MRTNVYVDGFNLYFRALKGTPYKWLDIRALCGRLLKPHHVLGTIKYFTANVSGTDSDPDKPHHQQLYIRALKESWPHLEVIRGQFRSHEVTKRLVHPINGQKYALVHDRKEKGSDVNLAVHLMNDAWRDDFEAAVIISCDSDLAEAVRLIREYHPQKLVGVLVPGLFAAELRAVASFTKFIRPNALAASQFPATIPGTNISKPADW